MLHFPRNVRHKTLPEHCSSKWHPRVKQKQKQTHYHNVVDDGYGDDDGRTSSSDTYEIYGGGDVHCGGDFCDHVANNEDYHDGNGADTDNDGVDSDDVYGNGVDTDDGDEDPDYAFAKCVDDKKITMTNAITITTMEIVMAMTRRRRRR